MFFAAQKKQNNRKRTKRDTLKKKKGKGVEVYPYQSSFSIKKKQGRKNNRLNSREKFSIKNFVVKILNTIFDFNFNHDKKLFYTFLVLVILGVVFIYSSTIVFSYDFHDGNKFVFLFTHIKYILVGFLLFPIFYFVRPKILIKFWPVFLTFSIALLAYIVILTLMDKAETINGATRWVDIGKFQFQPSEFAKLSFVIFLAAFISKKNKKYQNFKEFTNKYFFPFCIWMAIIIALVLLGKNLATSMVLGFIALTCYFASLKSKYHILGFIVLFISMIFAGVLFTTIEGYRTQRYDVWKTYITTGDTDPEQRDGEAYQFNQVLISIGSGGLYGNGLGNSTGKYYFVNTTPGDDNIFAVIGDELGFFRTSMLLILYLFLILRLITLAKEHQKGESYYYYTLIGVAAWIGFQSFVHFAANLGEFPLTGQTLPFISLGGSSLISLICTMGLALNITKQPKSTIEEDQA